MNSKPRTTNLALVAAVAAMTGFSMAPTLALAQTTAPGTATTTPATTTAAGTTGTATTTNDNNGGGGGWWGLIGLVGLLGLAGHVTRRNVPPKV